MNHASILGRSHYPSAMRRRIRRGGRVAGAVTSVDLHRRTRSARYDAIARAAAVSLRYMRRVLQRALVRYRQHRVAVETMRALRALDDRTLHDLGYDRSQIQSIAIELSRAR